MSEQPPNPPNPLASIGIDGDFLSRVHRTSLIVLFLGAIFIWERLSAPASLGWMVGGLLNLGMLAGVEMTVKRFVRPGTRSLAPMTGLLILKLLLAMGVLLLIFLAARQRWINPVWVLFGFVLPHAVLVLKLVGQKLRALSQAAERQGQR